MACNYSFTRHWTRYSKPTTGFKNSSDIRGKNLWSCKSRSRSFCCSLYCLICWLRRNQREKLGKAFKTLADLERGRKLNLALTDYGRAARNLQEAVKHVDNFEDLSNLLEAHDLIDELHILATLFSQQLEVIAKMIRSYRKTDELSRKDNHMLAVSWLKQAETKVKGYNDKCKELTKDCDKIIDMVIMPEFKIGF